MQPFHFTTGLTIQSTVYYEKLFNPFKANTAKFVSGAPNFQIMENRHNLLGEKAF